MNHLTKTGISSIAAAGISLGLFAIMNGLISHDYEVSGTEPSSPKLPALTYDKPDIIDHTTVMVEPPVEVEDQPVTPIIPQAQTKSATTALIFHHKTTIKPTIDGPTITDGGLLATVKVQPIYPSRATTLGLEGDCTVVYSVLASGAVSNVRVVEDQCSHKAFHKASIKAAQKFKYRPRIVDGQAMVTHNVKNRFTYRLQ